MIYLVGVGGATCSGKTTLAKHIHRILGDKSYIVHQDDFAPPVDLVPMNEEFGVQDWDDPPGAIDWPRMRAAVDTIKATGKLPDGHTSHDHLNAQIEVPLPPGMVEFWQERFLEVMQKRRESTGSTEEITWAILDGFLLFYDQHVSDAMDVRIMLRVPEAELIARRNARPGYTTAAQTDPEGLIWKDPPHYWERIVYPAYVKAHSHLFIDGDVEKGEIKPELAAAPLSASHGAAQNVRGIRMLEAHEMSMAELVDATCRSMLRLLGGEAEDLVGTETPAFPSPVLSDAEEEGEDD
ncbi:P-loop containing nucleoside triphosphate hydrolase protein [Clavulina sp. PMI_390]|nr:P-loop containing nucleoside triphosphate hydrolase protein [Clavulina sp. PMI_390]